MKKEILEEINRMKVLGGILSEAPGPTSIIPSLIAKITKTSLDDSILKSFKVLEQRGVISIDKVTNTIAKIEWVRLTDDEIKLLFRAKPLRDILKDVTSKAGIDITNPAQRVTFKGNFKRIVKGYDEATGSVFNRNSSPRPSGTPRGSANPFDTLQPVTIPQDTKNAFIEMMNKKGIKINLQDLDNVMIELQKSVDQQLAKAEKTFKDPTFVKTLQAYNRLPLSEQEQIINKVIESVKKSYGEYLLGLKVTTKTKENLQSLWDKSVDAFFLGQKEKGKMLDWASFLSWWKKSIGVSLGLFTYSIYVEAVRNEDNGWVKNLGFVTDKIIQAPERLMKSLIPGANLIYSSAAAISQTFLFSVEYISKKLNGEPEKKPTLKQQLKTGIKKGEDYIDSTYKSNKPKIDSLTQVLKPKVNSFVDKLKSNDKLDSSGKEQIIDPFKQ